MTSFRELACRWLWLAGWLGMLLVHAKPLFEETLNIFRATPVESQAFSPIRFLVLTLASVFFVLKIVDVPWLRFRSDFRATVSWLIIVSVLHLGVLSRAFDADAHDPLNGNLATVLFVGGALATASAAAFLRFTGKTSRRAIRSIFDLSFHSNWIWCAALRSWCGISRTNPRGPPLGL